MSDPENYEANATLIDPVPTKVGAVSIEEAAEWTGWVYCNAESYAPDPIAMFTDRALALAFVAFLASDACPEDLRTNTDAAIMAAYVPQIVIANHMDDAESIEAMATVSGMKPSAWADSDAAVKP